ncbi:orotidine-5'-phosphate decarboxylase [Canibacter sp. lx-72]|uniref:orotidine-5'-phosphate decarboxylase n=1 Tax=Canibacter zhuwentaonis TaxID=2837491 RepID=UPI001BDC2D85|nr:orotidine-5'-phosphate decarboxylase [Canibacter zhuwentaonis]MBT1017789.1 orotidine-5'-phosphate decarboxylase [Canibacter zhuwentaonis]
MSFATALDACFTAGKRLCVGVDPHPYLLAAWGYPNSAAGVREFGLRVVEAAASQALAIKPQIAFFERFGSAGYAALEQILSAAREIALPVIADIKRGDIGSSFAAYAQAWLTPGAPLEVDAITVHPYQGVGSLQPGFELARQYGKGMFLLAATSNPGAASFQLAKTGTQETVAASVVREVNELNRAHAAAISGSCGQFGVVLGATLQLAEYEIAPSANDTQVPVMPVLAPGFGAQGAALENVKNIYGALSAGVIPNESRSLLQGGAEELSARITARATEIRKVFRG